eukprot:COSAG06_NODE_81_length_25302_cov_21.168902_1_plen_124_part_00
MSAAKEHRGKSLAACAPGAPSWRIAWVKSGSSTPGLREQVVQEGLSEVEVAWLEALEAGHRILMAAGVAPAGAAPARAAAAGAAAARSWVGGGQRACVCVRGGGRGGGGGGGEMAEKQGVGGW